MFSWDDGGATYYIRGKEEEVNHPWRSSKPKKKILFNIYFIALLGMYRNAQHIIDSFKIFKIG